MSNHKHQYKKPQSLLNRHILKNALKRDFKIGDIITLGRQGTFSALLYSNGNWHSLPIEKDSASYCAKRQKKKKKKCYVQLSYDGVNKFASTATLPKARQARHPVNPRYVLKTGLFCYYERPKRSRNQARAITSLKGSSLLELQTSPGTFPMSGGWVGWVHFGLSVTGCEHTWGYHEASVRQSLGWPHWYIPARLPAPVFKAPETPSSELLLARYKDVGVALAASALTARSRPRGMSMAPTQQHYYFTTRVFVVN
ncbi:hypothetical protein FLAG1_07763 [Fusarium langsethiae]|uniref:Uncharacterized protein n=1 Tax=Fusarium langsethiae TaxID=179993 RepID=A0A0M9ET58_FUSLA|nr:hypothetical protein FLAG1_07763 [Fusarium langsethiae]